MVLCVESFGSSKSDPIALVLKLPEINVQFAPDPERALSVRQTPPPAAAAQTRQPVFPQFGEIASAVIRPDVTYCAPLKVKILGSTALLGPIRCQAPTVFLPFPTPLVVATNRLNPEMALRLASVGMSSNGIARWAKSSKAAASGPPSLVGPGTAILLEKRSSKSFRNLLSIGALTSDLPNEGGLDVVRAVKPRAAAEITSDPAIARRR